MYMKLIFLFTSYLNVTYDKNTYNIIFTNPFSLLKDEFYTLKTLRLCVNVYLKYKVILCLCY